MRKRTLIFGVCLGLCLSAGALAESDQNMKDMVDNLVSQMRYQLEAQNKLLSDPKLLEAQAKQQYMYYQALLKAGFSKDQAMQLMVASARATKS